MVHVTADRVKDTTTTEGTGAITVSGTAPLCYRTFSAVCSTNDTLYYCIAHTSATEWEVGLGTYSAANQITRTTVISSSNSNNAVNFSAGTKEVFLTVIAQQVQKIPAGVAANTEIWAGTDNTKMVTALGLKNAQGFVQLTDASTIAVDFNNGINFYVTLAASGHTLGLPSNLRDGWSGCIRVIQGSGGSKTLNYNACWDFGVAGTPVLSTTAGKIDRLFYTVDNTSGSKIATSFLKSA